MNNWTGACSRIAVVLVFLNSVNQLRGAETEEMCSTPYGQAGVCVQLPDCPSIKAYLQSVRGRWPSDLRTLLIKSHCGFDGNMPKLCCPPTFEPFDESDADTEDAETESSQGGINNRNEQEEQKGSLPLPPSVERHPNLRLLTNQSCGDVNRDRLLGGNKTGFDEYPWMALIAHTTAEGRLSFECGGTVVSSRYVLTAAHCLPRDALAGVRVGEHDITTQKDCEGPPAHLVCSHGIQDFEIEEAIRHPGYVETVNNELRLQNDIGLIRIVGAINFTYDNALPICLPTSRELQRLDLDNLDVVVTGWGITEEITRSAQLLQINIPVVPNDICAKIHNRSTADGVGFRQLCAGGVRGVNSCGGDSGGPLQRVAASGGAERFVQFGIVSYGPRMCGRPDVPAVYTRVAYYMDWILDHMKP